MDTYSLTKYRGVSRNIKPLFEKPKTQAYLMATLSLFAISFFSVFAIRPTLQTITVLQRRITDMDDVNKRLEDKINLLIQAQAEYQRIEGNLPMIYSLLPTTPEFPPLLQKLELLAIENDATISSISFSPIVLYDKTTDLKQTDIQLSETDSQNNEEKNLDLSQESTVAPINQPASPSQAIPFSVGLTTDYARATQILEKITRLNRLIQTKNISLSPVSDGDQTSINLILESHSFYYPEY